MSTPLLPIVVAHQGSSEGVTPGSLDAYRAALEAGVEMVEVDVRDSADGHFLAIHDSHTQGRPISSQSLSQLEQALGPALVTLGEVCRLVADAGRMLMVDLKDTGREIETIEAVLGVLEPGQFVVSTLEDVSVRRLRRAVPEVDVGLSLGREKPRPFVRTRLSELRPLGRARAADACFLSVNWKLAMAGVVRQVSRVGLPVYVWTVDDDSELRRHLADPRLHGVITNRPERALELRLEQGRTA